MCNVITIKFHRLILLFTVVWNNVYIYIILMQLFLQIYFLLLTHNCAIATDCLLDDCQIAGLLAQAGLLDCQIAMDCLWIARLVIGCIVHCWIAWIANCAIRRGLC